MMKFLFNGLRPVRKLFFVRNVHHFSPRRLSLTKFCKHPTTNLLFSSHMPPQLPRRPIHQNPKRRHHENHKPNTPELIYVPDILRWLKTKFQFKYLQKTWDPEFTEGAFIYGSTRAICRITEIIHDDTPDELEGLLTTPGKRHLKLDMENRLTTQQKRLLKLKPSDIKIYVPLSVRFRNEGASKLCVVALRCLALKWLNQDRRPRLALIALQVEFVRDYKDGLDSEWTINVFDVLECAMLPENPYK